MNPNENQNPTPNTPEENTGVPIAPVITSVPVPSDTTVSAVKVPQPKKKSKTLPITVAFLAGAMTYAILAAGYNLYIQSHQENNGDAIKTAQIVTPQQQTDTNESIAEEDLNNYVQSTDCTTKPAFSSYKLLYELGDVMSIDLYDGMRAEVSTASRSGQFVFSWEELPKVVDYKCDTLAITKITKGDKVNIYTDQDAVELKGPYLNTRVIQKATK